MDREEISTAIFGVFDGLVSVIGFVFALLVHHAATGVIAVGGLGGAISATISMGTGQYEGASAEERPLGERLRLGGVMAAATLVGSMMPVWPFFLFGRTLALLVGAMCCLVMAAWIGHEKDKGWHGYLEAYSTLVGAAGITLAIVAAIPSAG